MTLEFFVVVPAVLVALVVAFLLGRKALTVVRWTERSQLLDEPVPDSWYEIASRTIPLFEGMSEAERHRLLKLAQLFLVRNHIEGCGGFEITEEVKVTIAGQACLLLLGSPFETFPTVRTILVYPRSYLAVDDDADEDIDFLESETHVETREGESWDFGTVVLSWADVVAGQSNPSDGRNLVLHEFAHQRDLESGATDGTPPATDPTSRQMWGKVLEEEYDKLVRDVRRGRHTVLDEYGASNRAEFFAVATEAFFETPVELRKHLPALYAELERTYGVAPARWDAHRR